MMGFFQGLGEYRWFWDTLDILLVATLLYGLLSLVRGTRAVYMLFGLLLAIVIFWISSFSELYTLNWILYHFFGSLLLIIVILFQNEIRRGLTRIGRKSALSMISPSQDSMIIEELIRSAVSLANKKIGALIVIEKEASISDYVELGIFMDSLVSKELLSSVFLPSSPIHDGAVLIQKGRISHASCFLPLSMNPHLDPDLGTRHRAAIGLTEETDAIVISVSEEKGWISIAMNGKIIRGVDAMALRKILIEQVHYKTSAWTKWTSDRQDHTRDVNSQISTEL
ncbi:MAG: diadenylate cyclase CdaA [Bdellovibrionales bacterium]|nr:diadenylate cyclase CdaA [Bdellovibrionales bacterium]